MVLHTSFDELQLFLTGQEYFQTRLAKFKAVQK